MVCKMQKQVHGHIYADSEALEIYMRVCANLLMAAICLISQSNSFVLVETFIET